MSSLTITPNIERKTAKVVGTVSAGEKISVTLKNCASLDTATLRLRVMLVNKMLAVFPVPPAAGEEQKRFTVDGDDLVCTLNLCTFQMMKRFRRVPAMEVMFVLDDVASSVRQVYFFGFREIFGWPQEPGSDIPIDLAGYGDKIAELEGHISDLASAHDADMERIGEDLAAKVDKEEGKGLSHVDVTQETIGRLALRSELDSHVEDSTIHITQQERSAWNAKADASAMPGKQDVIVQDGFLYVPDRDVAGRWHRMQAYYDSEMEGVTTTCGNDNYVRDSDGTFILEA